MIQEKACSVKKKEVSEMLKRINDFLAGLPMTIIGGVLLVFSFALPRTGMGNGCNLRDSAFVSCGVADHL